jgi:hypothetical protein
MMFPADEDEADAETGAPIPSAKTPTLKVIK